MIVLLLALVACGGQVAPAATPTIDPAIYNQVPKTTTFGPGQCQVVLNAPAPAYTSNTLGGQPSGQIPAGTYEVFVAAQYSTSLWYGLSNVGTANYINSTSVSSTTGNCGSSSSSSNPLANTKWQVTDYADPKNTTGMTTVLSGTMLTAEFSADNKLAGSAGCNSYSGTYQVQGESLTIPGPLAVTMMMCAENVMAQEQVFLTNLQAVASYKLDSAEPQLHLLNSKGQVIILLKKP
jgi:heat shock protein HslJ